SRHLPARTEAERLCLQVIGYVTCLPDDPPGAVDAAVRRLEGEFAAELRRHGAIRLPDLTPAAAEAQMGLARRELPRSRLGAAFGLRPPGPDPSPAPAPAP
ncbi:MAG TPA: hypothetical protein VGF55_03155, partial [Gemmataceae bacterium]